MARRIFRESALRRYNERMEKIELPRYAKAPWPFLGWLAALLLLLLTGLLLNVRLPDYAAGPSFVAAGDHQQAVVTVLLPAAVEPQIERGQTAEITLPADFAGSPGMTISGAVIDIESPPLSPAAARQRFAAEPALGGFINGPVVVAHVSVDLPGQLWAGGVGQARIEVGSRTLLALVPGLFAREAGLAEEG